MRARRRFLFSTLALAAAPFLNGCVNLPPSLFGARRGPMKLEVIEPAKSRFTFHEIAVIDVTGPIVIDQEEGWFGGGGGGGTVVQMKDRLAEAERNPFLKGILLRIDSPGGGVTASDLLHHEIGAFKKRMAEDGREIPVVALMQDVAASGGVYAAMAADEIYAVPTATTGSIGVITILPGLEGLADKIGLEMRVVKSGASKDLGSPWRGLSEEEKAVFQRMIDSMYARFLQVILAARESKGLGEAKLRSIADGRVLTAAEAMEAKLIDGVMYPEEALERVRELAGIRDAQVVSYEYPGGYRGNIYARAASPSAGARPFAPGEVNLLKIGGSGLNLPKDARFLYMWLP